QPLLATDVVRFVGEPVAVVVTEQRYQGEDAGDLVDVDYDMLTPVIDMTTAADVGGAFGAKFGADPEHGVVCWVARELGRPARWAETRNENLVGMTHGRAQIQKVTIGGSRDGTVGAYRIEILQDSGAYPRFGAFLPALTILMAPGPYAFPRAEAVATSVVTNTTPVGAYRGAGRPEATAAVERAMDLFAAEIG